MPSSTPSVPGSSLQRLAYSPLLSLSTLTVTEAVRETVSSGPRGQNHPPGCLQQASLLLKSQLRKNHSESLTQQTVTLLAIQQFNKAPGHSIQDNAIAHASNWLWKGFEIPWTGPRWETDPLHQVYYTPEEFDVLDFGN